MFMGNSAELRLADFSRDPAFATLAPRGNVRVIR